jgi:hypothetical protein
METGSRGRYFWLTSADHDLDYLLTSCPQIFLGRYLTVTSFDSGSLVPNEDEVVAGWECRGGIAYSPKIESVEKLLRIPGHGCRTTSTMNGIYWGFREI